MAMRNSQNISPNIRLNEGSFSVTFDHNESVILNLRNNCFHGLNESATFILQQLQTGKEIPSVEREFCERYGVTAATARQDVASLCDALRARSLVTD
jgi:hypothetical protein